jgi:limonene-1,2-epoxide hydrolase
MSEVSAEVLMGIVEQFHEDMSHIDPDKLTDLFTDDGYIQMMMKEPYQGREEIHKMFSIWASHYADVVTKPLSVIGSGNKVAIEWVDTSDHDGKHYEIPCAGIFEFDGEKIAAWRIYYDYALEQGQTAGLKPRKSLD